MFHFLHKTYLKYHEMFEYYQDSILCFDDGSDEVNFDTEVGHFLTGVKSQVLFHAKTSEEMVAKYKGDKRFFKELQTYSGSKRNGKLNIYCDSPSFNKLIVKLWKTIFPKLDADTAYIMYDIGRNDALFQTRWDWHDEHDANPNDYHLKYWCHDKESFTELFNSQEAFDVDKKFYQNISSEYLIALYMSHPEDFKEILGKRYVHFFNKNLVNDINNLKKELEDQIYELDEIWSELGRQDYDNFDFNKIISIKPELSFLSSPDFNSAKSIKELDMESLIPVMKDYIKWDFTGCEELWSLHQYLKEEKIPQAEELIAIDLNHKDNRMHPTLPILSKMHHMGKANMYMVDFFISQKDSLDKFKLN
jgi:hypothetical protein